MWPCLVRLLPILDARVRLFGSTFEALAIRCTEAVAGLPLVLVIFVAKLEGRGAERPFDAVFPNTDVDATIREFVNGLSVVIRCVGHGALHLKGGDARNVSGNL